MSKHRHKKADGGRTGLVASGNPDVLKEAKGKEDYAKGDERKRGGKVVKMDGKHGKHRMDRSARKRGGAVGADRSPLSTAHRSTKAGGPSSEDTYGGTPP